MAESISCENCLGPLRAVCEQITAEETGLIRLVQSLDHDEVAIALTDPTLTVESKKEIVEAAEIENVHLTDYRLGVIASKLIAVGCKLDEERIKNKLLNRLAGI